MSHFFAGLIASLAAIGSLLIPSSTIVIAPAAVGGGSARVAAQTAIIAAVPITSAPIATPSSIIGASSTPAVAPGLLPKVKNIKFVVAKAAAAVPIAPTAASAAAPVRHAVVPPAVPAAVAPATPPPPAAQPVTAQSFLASTTVSFKETRDGSYELTFNASVGGQTVSWGLSQTQVGGAAAGGAPQFSLSYSCDPVPDPAAPGAFDQNPFFRVNTPYDCAISLTPLEGADLRAVSKDFSFTTPAGQLMVSTPSSISTLLVNGENNGGIVFTNTDASPVTVTGLVFDASYSYLATMNGPLVLRFLDPATSQPLGGDYHLENSPADPSSPFTYAETGEAASVSFTIPASGKKMLPFEVLGVSKMLVSNTTPSITIAIRGVSTDRGLKTVLQSPSITWSCVVSLAGYDPNATSDAYATGEACRN